MKDISIEHYVHEETILRFMDMYDLQKEPTTEIFHEMKKLLQLLHTYSKTEYVFTHEPLWILDEMWHTFLLYSIDYERFCQKYFGEMIYHQPIARAQKMKVQQQLDDEEPEAVAEVTKHVERLYELIFELHGRDTLIKWVNDFGNRYTIPFMNEIRKPIA